jgi:hypothetical protein
MAPKYRSYRYSIIFIKSFDMHRMMVKNNSSHERMMLEFEKDYIRPVIENVTSINDFLSKKVV